MRNNNELSPDQLAFRYFSNGRPVTNESVEQDVELYDNSSAFRVPVAQAWRDATFACRGLPQLPRTPTKAWNALQHQTWPRLLGWLAVGFDPQRLADVTLAQAKVDRAESLRVISNIESLAQNGPLGERLLASGLALRLQNPELAKSLLFDTGNPEPAWLNQYAVLLHATNNITEAIRIWQMLDHDYTPATYNLGLAYLHQSETTQSSEYLVRAYAQLPSDSGWHHMAQWYLLKLEANKAGLSDF